MVALELALLGAFGRGCSFDALIDAQVSVSVLHVGSDRDQVRQLEGLKMLIMGGKD